MTISFKFVENNASICTKPSNEDYEHIACNALEYHTDLAKFTSAIGEVDINDRQITYYMSLNLERRLDKTHKLYAYNENKDFVGEYYASKIYGSEIFSDSLDTIGYKDYNNKYVLYDNCKNLTLVENPCVVIARLEPANYENLKKLINGKLFVTLVADLSSYNMVPANKFLYTIVRFDILTKKANLTSAFKKEITKQINPYHTTIDINDIKSIQNKTNLKIIKNSKNAKPLIYVSKFDHEKEYPFNIYQRLINKFGFKIRFLNY